MCVARDCFSKFSSHLETCRIQFLHCAMKDEVLRMFVHVCSQCCCLHTKAYELDAKLCWYLMPEVTSINEQQFRRFQ